MKTPLYLAIFVIAPWMAHADSLFNVDLGTADSFAVLAGSAITNAGVTNVFGDLGLWPGNVITGFPPGIVSSGTIHGPDDVTMQAQSDLTAAYNFAAHQACGTSLTGQDLGGLTLTPGSYCFTSPAQLTGVLTLNAHGDPNAVFLFQMSDSLTTAVGSSVVFSDGGQGRSVFWQVGSSATLNPGTSFAGTILALTSITLNTGATIQYGRALAQNGAVTLDSNTIDTGASAVPEPSYALLLVLLFSTPGLLRLRKLIPKAASQSPER